MFNERNQEWLKPMHQTVSEQSTIKSILNFNSYQCCFSIRLLMEIHSKMSCFCSDNWFSFQLQLDTSCSAERLTFFGVLPALVCKVVLVNRHTKHKISPNHSTAFNGLPTYFSSIQFSTPWISCSEFSSFSWFSEKINQH